MSRKNFNTLRLHGKVSGDVYRKEVQGSKHRLNRPPAWAIDCQDLKNAERLGATRIEIHDCETQIIYTSTVENFRAHALPVNRGFGPQLALELKYWGIVATLATGGINPVKTGRVERAKPQALQLGLFREVRR